MFYENGFLIKKYYAPPGLPKRVYSDVTNIEHLWCCWEIAPERYLISVTVTTDNSLCPQRGAIFFYKKTVVL
jgi:hypothetical protein